MKRSFLSAIGLIGLAFAYIDTAEATDKRTINMACTNFPPYKIEGKDGMPNRGIDLDVMKSAFEAVGYPVKFEFFPWKRTVRMVESGQADGLCGCAYRPERETPFIFSDMLGNHSQGIFLKDESEIKSVDKLSQLSGKSVAAVRGYAVHNELKENPDVRAIEANDDSQLLTLLNANRVDAIYSYRDIILYRMSFNNAAKKVRYFEFNSQPYYLCFSRKKADMRQIVDDFNRGLRTIRYDGRYQKIWEKYR